MTLREIRRQKGLTSKHVAEVLGIKPRTLNKKERSNNFTTLQIGVLCKLYKIKLGDVDI